jgi:WD40 repeat protein
MLLVLPALAYADTIDLGDGTLSFTPPPGFVVGASVGDERCWHDTVGQMSACVRWKPTDGHTAEELLDAALQGLACAVPPTLADSRTFNGAHWALLRCVVAIGPRVEPRFWASGTWRDHAVFAEISSSAENFDLAQGAIGRDFLDSIRFDATTASPSASSPAPSAGPAPSSSASTVAPDVIALSADGARLAVATSSDRTVRIWDTAQRTVLATRVLAESPAALAWTPDGSLVVLVKNSALYVLDRDGHDVARHAVPGVAALAVLPNGTVAAGADHTTFLASPGLQPARGYADDPGYALHLAASPDGKRIAIGGAYGSVDLRDAHTGKRLFQLDIGPSTGLVAFPDARTLAVGTTADGKGAVLLFDVATGQRRSTLPTGPVTTLCGALGGLAWSAAGAPAEGYDVSASNPVERWHAASNAPIACSADGKLVAITGPQILGLDAATGAVVWTLPGS